LSALQSFVLFSPDWPAARASASPARGTGYHRGSLFLFLAKGAAQDSCPHQLISSCSALVSSASLDWRLFFVDFDFSIACGSLQGEVGIILELLDRKARGFIVQIALPW
jgi:hypothetical protein